MFGFTQAYWFKDHLFKNLRLLSYSLHLSSFEEPMIRDIDLGWKTIDCDVYFKYKVNEFYYDEENMSPNEQSSTVCEKIFSSTEGLKVSMFFVNQSSISSYNKTHSRS